MSYKETLSLLCGPNRDLKTMIINGQRTMQRHRQGSFNIPNFYLTKWEAKSLCEKGFFHSHSRPVFRGLHRCLFNFRVAVILLGIIILKGIMTATNTTDVPFMLSASLAVAHGSLGCTPVTSTQCLLDLPRMISWRVRVAFPAVHNCDLSSHFMRPIMANLHD